MPNLIGIRKPVPYKGLWTKIDSEHIPDEYCVDMVNVLFDYAPALKQRAGTTIKIDNAWGSQSTSGITDMFFHIDTDSGREVFLMINTLDQLYENYTGSTVTHLKTFNSTSTHYSFLSYNNHAIITYVSNGIWRYISTSAVFRVGISQSVTSTPMASIAAATGVLNGKYKYVFTARSTAGGIVRDSNPTTSTTTVNAQGHQIVVSTSVYTNEQVDKIAIWRTVANGTKFLFLAEVSNTSTSFPYMDNTPDTYLGDEVDTDRFTPPYCHYAWIHRNTLILANAGGSEKSTIYFSKINDIDAFPVTNFEYVARNDGDEITGGVFYNNSSWIFKNNSVWRLVGNDIDDFRLIPMPGFPGCSAPKTIKIDENSGYLYWLHNTGLYRTNGSVPERVTERIDNLFSQSTNKHISSFFPYSIRLQTQRSWVETFGDYIVFGLNNGVGTAGNNKLIPNSPTLVLLYHTKLDAWGKYQHATETVFSDAKLAVPATSGEAPNLFLSSANRAKLYQFFDETQTTDDGNPIPAFIQTKSYNFDTHNDKIFSSFQLEWFGSNNETLSLDFQVKGVSKQTKTVSTSISPYKLKHTFHLTGEEVKGKTLQLRLSTSAYGLLVSGMTFHFTDLGRKHIVDG